MPQANTRGVTDYIKGVAILLVIATHYVSYYNMDSYNRWLSNYAHAFIGSFFILGGYGAFYSLEKRFGAGAPATRTMAGYFWSRALRIYPLYWVALLVSQWYFNPELFAFQTIGAVRTIGVFLAFPLSDSPLWFIVAMVQCYIFAPLFYLLLKRLGGPRFAFFILALAGVMLLASELYTRVTEVGGSGVLVRLGGLEPLKYRNIFFGNLILFAAGMLIPRLVNKYKKLNNGAVFYAVTAEVIVFSIFLRIDRIKLHYDLHEAEVFYFLSLWAFCLIAIATRPLLPLNKLLALFGRHSFSLYLFHGAFFSLLLWLGLLEPDQLRSLAAILVLFPFFVGACVGVDAAAAFLLAWWRGYYQRHRPGAIPA